MVDADGRLLYFLAPRTDHEALLRSLSLSTQAPLHTLGEQPAMSFDQPDRCQTPVERRQR
jgi:hypothetical protein